GRRAWRACLSTDGAAPWPAGQRDRSAAADLTRFFSAPAFAARGFAACGLAARGLAVFALAVFALAAFAFLAFNLAAFFALARAAELALPRARGVLTYSQCQGS